MFDVNQITSTLRGMGDRALQQYAMMNKGDPYILSLAVSESNQRKQLRTAAQARAMAPRPKVADAAIAGIAEAPPAVDAMGNVTGMASGGLPEDQGIGRLPAPNIQRMADGGIAGFDESSNAPITTQRLDNMGNTGGMFNYAQDGGGVVHMAGGGGGLTEMSKLVLKELGETPTKYLQDPDVKRTVDKLVQERLGTTATKAAPTTATTAAAATKEGVLYNPAKLAGQATKATTTALKGVPYVSGAIGAYEGLSDANKASGFYNDPNVSTLEKAKQAGLTTLKAGLPIAGAGLGSFAGPLGTFGGGVAGTAAAEYLDFDSDALKEWKKANPQATPEETKKAAAKIIPTYSPDQQANAEAQRLGLKVNPNTMSKPVEAADVANNGGGGGQGGAGGGGGGGTSAQSVKDMYNLFMPQNQKETQLNDIERQYKELAESKTSAAQRDYQQLQDDLAARGEYGKDRETKLKGKEERIGKEEGQAGGLALLEAGLAMMAGTSQHAFANIGQGAMAGTAAYRKSMDKIADARDKLDDAYGRLEDVRFNQKSMDSKELRAAKKGVDDATNAGIESLIGAASRRFDINRDEAKTMFGAGISLKQAEIAAAPGIARNKMLEKRFSGDEKKMAEYTKVQRQVMSDLKNDTNYASATPEVQAKLMQTRMRQAMLNNPFLSSYAMGIGFESSPTSKGARNEDDDI